MKAGDELLSTVFSKDHRYVIPIFQRPYIWDEQNNWRPLWADLRKAAEDVEDESGHESEDPMEYFLGAFVTQYRPPTPRRKPTSDVIDGQQRMTTIQVFLAAARRVATELECREAADNFASLTSNRVSPDSDHPEDRFKIAPLANDRAAFEWSMRPPGDESTAPDPTHRLVRASDWFERQILAWAREHGNEAARLDYLHFAIEHRVKVVSIFLDAKDDPQVIFEVLNHRGVSLDAADLIKNLLFRELERQGDGHLAHELLHKYWNALDSRAWRAEVTTGRVKRSRVDVLLAYWLSAQRGEETSIEHLFDDFKRWMRTTRSRVAEVIPNIRAYADTMDRLENLPISDPVAQVIDRMDATNTTTPWPLLLFLHAEEAVPAEQATAGALAIDSFIMRRAICRVTTADYNRLFSAVLRDLKATDLSRAGDDLRDALARQTAVSRAWPDDETFIAGLRNPNLYRDLIRARLRTLLVGIENHLMSPRSEPGSTYRSKTPALSIEHILPVTWQEHWPLHDDEDEEAYETREAVVHSLGNLTLATKSLNSTLSNSPWSKKRHLLTTHSRTRLTSAAVLTYPGLAQNWTQETWAEVWDELRIDLRAQWLVTLALEAWPRPDHVPTFDGDLLATDELVQQSPTRGSQYTEERSEPGPVREPAGATRRRKRRNEHAVRGDLVALLRAGLIRSGDTLRYSQKRAGETYEGVITNEGTIRTNAGVYRAPSSALIALIGSNINGWTAWTHVQSGRTLAQLRSMTE